MRPTKSSSDEVVPVIGKEANMLGAREPPNSHPDIHPDSTGHVGPNGQGLSVAPSPEALPFHCIPARLRDKYRGARGNNALRVFRLGEAIYSRAPIGKTLELLPTNATHGVIQPKQQMLAQEYQNELAATQHFWVDEE